MHGYAGYSSGGTFTLADDGASWERPSGVGVSVHLQSTDGPLVAEEPPYVEDEVPHVHQFELNREVANHAVLDGVITALEPDFLAILAPWEADPAEISVQRIDVNNGMAYEITASGESYFAAFEGQAGNIEAPGWSWTVDSSGAAFTK